MYLHIDNQSLGFDTSTSTPRAADLSRVALVLEALAQPDVSPADVLGGGDTRAARKALRELARKYPTLRSAAIVALLVHYPRVGGGSGGEFERRTSHPFEPATPPVFNWSASTSAAVFAVSKNGAAAGWDHIDDSAAREGEALETLADINDFSLPQQPYVLTGREIECALMLGRVIPARNSGHFQKQNAIKGAERVARGGEGKREIVTRDDKARRAINAAARKLDAVEARIKRETPTPLALAALALVRSILQCA
jgi:hypothetical protein